MCLIPASLAIEREGLLLAFFERPQTFALVLVAGCFLAGLLSVTQNSVLAATDAVMASTLDEIKVLLMMILSSTLFGGGGGGGSGGESSSSGGGEERQEWNVQLSLGAGAVAVGFILFVWTKIESRAVKERTRIEYLFKTPRKMYSMGVFTPYTEVTSPTEGIVTPPTTLPGLKTPTSTGDPLYTGPQTRFRTSTVKKWQTPASLV